MPSFRWWSGARTQTNQQRLWVHAILVKDQALYPKEGSAESNSLSYKHWLKLNIFERSLNCSKWTHSGNNQIKISDVTPTKIITSVIYKTLVHGDPLFHLRTGSLAGKPISFPNFSSMLCWHGSGLALKARLVCPSCPQTGGLNRLAKRIGVVLEGLAYWWVNRYIYLHITSWSITIHFI